MINYGPFYLKRMELLTMILRKVLFTWSYISDRLLDGQEQPLLERCVWNLNMLQVCLLWTQSACGSHTHSRDKTWKKGTYDLLYQNPYFIVTIWKIQMGSSLNCRKKIVNFIIWFDLSDSIKGSFAIDTQMPIVFFLCGQLCTRSRVISYYFRTVGQR